MSQPLLPQLVLINIWVALFLSQRWMRLLWAGNRRNPKLVPDCVLLLLQRASTVSPTTTTPRNSFGEFTIKCKFFSPFLNLICIYIWFIYSLATDFFISICNPFKLVCNNLVHIMHITLIYIIRGKKAKITNLLDRCATLFSQRLKFPAKLGTLTSRTMGNETGIELKNTHQQ